MQSQRPFARPTLACLAVLGWLGVHATAAGLDDHIVYNRGLPLWEVIGSVQVSSGSSIWVMDADSPGSAPMRLTPNESASSLMPSWGPGKLAVVFSSNRLNNNGSPTPPLDLWSISSSGGEPVRLTATAGHNWTPAWSPDGSRIAFASTRRAPPAEIDEVWYFDIFIMDSDGSDQRCLFDGGVPVFSADGSTVYLVSEQPECYQLWQVPADEVGGCSGGGSATPLTDNGGNPICGEDPSLSRDGTTLYFASQGQLAALDLASRQVAWFDWTEEPWIAPDGERYCHMAGGDVWAQEVIDTGGSTAVQVTSTADAFFPRWSSPGPGPGDAIFADGFESGSLSAWSSASVPNPLRAW